MHTNSKNSFQIQENEKEFGRRRLRKVLDLPSTATSWPTSEVVSERQQPDAVATVRESDNNKLCMINWRLISSSTSARMQLIWHWNNNAKISCLIDCAR